MWQCKFCHNVFHFECIKTWAKPNQGTTIPTLTRNSSWICPLCFIVCHEQPRATCWCGKRPSDDGTVSVTSVLPGRPNSCSHLCAEVANCMHNQRTEPCQKTCHPGPCNQPCKTSCGVPPQTVTEKHSAWAGLCSRFRARKPGLICAFVVITIFTIGVEFSIIRFVIQHIKWWTQPWRYQYFTEVSSKYEAWILVFVGLFVVLPFQLCLVAAFASSFCSLFTYLLNLDDTQTRKELKDFTKSVGSIFLVVMVIAAILAPTIA